MSRAMNLAMTPAEVLADCEKHHVAVSALESLPQGGARLVCCTSYDAHQTRKRLEKKLIAGSVIRTLHLGRRLVS